MTSVAASGGTPHLGMWLLSRARRAALLTTAAILPLTTWLGAPTPCQAAADPLTLYRPVPYAVYMPPSPTAFRTVYGMVPAPGFHSFAPYEETLGYPGGKAAAPVVKFSEIHDPNPVFGETPGPFPVPMQSARDVSTPDLAGAVRLMPRPGPDEVREELSPDLDPSKPGGLQMPVSPENTPEGGLKETNIVDGAALPQTPGRTEAVLPLHHADAPEYYRDFYLHASPPAVIRPSPPGSASSPWPVLPGKQAPHYMYISTSPPGAVPAYGVPSALGPTLTPVPSAPYSFSSAGSDVATGSYFSPLLFTQQLVQRLVQQDEQVMKGLLARHGPDLTDVTPAEFVQALAHADPTLARLSQFSRKHIGPTLDLLKDAHKSLVEPHVASKKETRWDKPLETDTHNEVAAHLVQYVQGDPILHTISDIIVNHVFPGVEAFVDAEAPTAGQPLGDAVISHQRRLRALG